MEVWLANSADWLLQNMVLLVIVLFASVMALELCGRSFGDSTNVSFARLSTNFGLAALTGGLSLLVPISSIVSSVLAKESGMGLFNLVEAHWAIILLTSLLVRTFAGYWLHRAFHAVPSLWRLHRVHHSDTQFDLTLSLRSHPFDYFLRIVVFAGTAFLLGMPVWVVVLVDMILTAANFWEHADTRLPKTIDRVLGSVVATPNIHRLHHSAWQPQADSNFSSGLIIWDRIFGTFRSPHEEEPERIGLGDSDDANADSLWQQLRLPFAPPTAEHDAIRSVKSPHE